MKGIDNDGLGMEPDQFSRYTLRFARLATAVNSCDSVTWSMEVTPVLIACPFWSWPFAYFP